VTIGKNNAILDELLVKKEKEKKKKKKMVRVLRSGRHLHVNRPGLTVSGRTRSRVDL
jgi:hypothetical protein